MTVKPLIDDVNEQGNSSPDETAKLGLAEGISIAASALFVWWMWYSLYGGLDVELYSCGYEIQDCEWDSNVSAIATCTVKNTSEDPLELIHVRTWSFSSSGIYLDVTPVGTAIIPKGRLAKINLTFDEDAERAYICPRWTNPESPAGKEVTKSLGKKLTIS